VQIAEKEIVFVIVVTTATFLFLTAFFCILIIIFQKSISRKQQQLFKAVLETQENERQRIGKDLHDEMGPLLSAVKLNLGLFNTTSDKKDINENVQYTSDLLDNAIKGIRETSHNLMPGTLNSYGLIPAIEEICSRISRPGTMQISFTHKDVSEDLSSFSKINLYRIIQEILNNAVKHSDASHLHVSFSMTGKLFLIDAFDNGKGFRMDSQSDLKGIGLKNIENRVKLLGGKFSIFSEPEKGTRITVAIESKKLL
jgi:two-component system, NarL family, sensor kinase